MPEDEVIDVQPETAVATVGETALMPAMSVQAALDRYGQMQEFIKSVMVEGLGKDYGVIPGTTGKRLYKSGAEKLCALFGLAPEFETLTEVEEWGGEEPFFYYKIRCTLLRHGVACGQAIGSANSRETRYRWRWVNKYDVPPAMDLTPFFSKDGTLTEFVWAVDKAETEGRFGKPVDYWARFKEEIAAGNAVKTKKKKKGGQEDDAWEIGSRVYRIPNPEIADQVHTVLSIAQKRALVGAVRVTTGSSSIFVETPPGAGVGTEEPPPPPTPPDLREVKPGQKPFDYKLMLRELENQKGRLVQLAGKVEGEGFYYRVMSGEDCKHSNDIKSRQQGERIWHKLQEEIERREKPLTPEDESTI